MSSYQERNGPSNATLSIMELRQYTLCHGKRDVLIDVFEREFIDAQEKAGIRVVGQFCDLDNPDRFVWLRGFPDMPSRHRMLDSFYSCPEWRANRDMVNEILVDYDNVLLLRNAWTNSGFQIADSPRTDSSGTPLVTANIHYLRLGDVDGFASFFKTHLEPLLRQTGAVCLAALITETAPNNYPRLPIREGESVFVSFHIFESLASRNRHLESLARATAWPAVRAEMERWHVKRPQTLRLAPTSRSKLG